MLRRAIFLTTCLILTSCSTPQPREIPLPVCNQPIPVDAEIWNDLDLMRDTMSHNDLVYQECIERYKQMIIAFS